MTRGLFLSLDGIDGTGKSTQCRLLADWLRGRGHEVVTCADPGGTAVGAALREIVLHHRGEMAPACEAFLFMASRAQLVAEVIDPALASGRVVVCDRFLLANVVSDVLLVAYVALLVHQRNAAAERDMKVRFLPQTARLDPALLRAEPALLRRSAN